MPSISRKQAIHAMRFARRLATIGAAYDSEEKSKGVLLGIVQAENALCTRFHGDSEGQRDFLDACSEGRDRLGIVKADVKPIKLSTKA